MLIYLLYVERTTSNVIVHSFLSRLHCAVTLFTVYLYFARVYWHLFMRASFFCRSFRILLASHFHSFSGINTNAIHLSPTSSLNSSQTERCLLSRFVSKLDHDTSSVSRTFTFLPRTEQPWLPIHNGNYSPFIGQSLLLIKTASIMIAVDLKLKGLVPVS